MLETSRIRLRTWRDDEVAESAGFRHAGTEREAFRLATHQDDRVTYDLLTGDL